MKPFEQYLYARTREVLQEDLGPTEFGRALIDCACLGLADDVRLACQPGHAETAARRRAKAAVRGG
jgi:hypothetical protein